MPIESQTPLKVLNASAGSGKTYNLVKEYIQLLIENKEDTIRFSRIIAMTFTNKAALEMKTRIISKLDELSYPEKYSSKSDFFAIEISQELGISKEEVHSRSLTVLQNILHRYEDFFVMTIDKFNLKLIRSFSRDLDLPSDFDVILNESEVIEQVVDLLLDQVGKEKIPNLTKVVYEYAKSNIEEGERWNFRNQLIDFGKILSKEKDQPIIDKLIKLDFSIDRFKELQSELKFQSNLFIEDCRKVYKLYENSNIPIDSLPGKSRTAAPIEKLAHYNEIPVELFTDTFLKVVEGEPANGRIFPAELRENLLELDQKYKEQVSGYYIQRTYLKNFYNMAMLQFMAKALLTLKKEEQLIRISEFNKLISELVRNEDAPFIYERLGTRFQHFLLDEFQDTSRLQWLNMVPLVHESISNQNKNLIVGDPKQSIYRFKNGVAEQFVALPKIYNPEDDPDISQKSIYFDQMGNVKSLDDNWRSSPTIINFNNTFFPILKDRLPIESKEFYNSIFQNAKAEFPGLVNIVSKQEKRTDSELVSSIISIVQNCENDGYRRGDICILGDKNKQANIWAIELTKAGYKIVSAESLLVQNEVKVKLVVSYLKRRLQPSADSEKKRFAEMLFRIKKGDSFERYQSYFETKIYNEKTYTYFNDDKFLQEQFGGKSNFFYKYENLYDLIQSFYKLMQWDELKNPYLHHFADFAHDYELNNGPDIKAFLNHYNNQKSKLAIQLPESDDAIKIMTIHKSKGLEFPVVILPSIDFDLGPRPLTKYLIEIDDLILYSSLSKKSAIRNIVDFNNQESNQILTDKVNQCYVAFTRPMERLYVLNYHSKSSFGNLAHSCFEQMEEHSNMEDGTLSLQFGKPFKPTKIKTQNLNEFFIPENISENLWFPDISLQDTSDLLQKTQLSPEQRFGNQFHLAMSLINNKNDIEKIIDQLNKEGEIENDFIIGIINKIKEIFELKSFNDLFKDAIEVLNEQVIILDEKTSNRPDKIILKERETILLDYKTGLPKNKDVKQMHEYIYTLRKMELPEVKGFLFYTYNNELIAI